MWAIKYRIKGQSVSYERRYPHNRRCDAEWMLQHDFYGYRLPVTPEHGTLKIEAVTAMEA